jgi:nucleoredoxin
VLIHCSSLPVVSSQVLYTNAHPSSISAHWCPPCRGFTPVAAEFYKSLAGSDPSALEVVFVSSDEDDESFSHYYDTMPWTALQFSDRSAAEALGAKFGIRGIPALIVLNPAGDVVDQDGRSTLTKNKDAPAGALASWVK